jgi:hypothetical protein
LRLGRWITLNRARGGISITLGAPGRRLTIGRHALSLRLGWPGSGFSATWRRSWRHIAVRLVRTLALAGRRGHRRISATRVTTKQPRNGGVR